MTRKKMLDAIWKNMDKLLGPLVSKTDLKCAKGNYTFMTNQKLVGVCKELELYEKSIH